MNEELDQEVIDDIINGRKVSAIKRLRSIRGLGLKEAKILVDDYCQDNNIVSSSNERGKGFGIILLLIFLAGLSYSLYVNFK